MTNPLPKISLAIGILAVVAAVGIAIVNTTKDYPKLSSSPSPEEISWNPLHFPLSMHNVSISVIEEINNNPHTYKLVRRIATSTPNDGGYLVQGLSLSRNQYIEIGCTESLFACTATRGQLGLETLLPVPSNQTQ